MYENNLNTIPVFYNTSEEFSLITLVSVYSLIKNSNPIQQYCIYILCSDLSEESKKRFQGIEKEWVRIEFVDMNHQIEEAGLKGICSVNDEISEVAIYRLFIPRLFTKYERVIYIDADTVVEDDLGELFALDIKDKIFAALKEPMNYALQERVENVIGLPYDKAINSGVLLIDCKKYVEHDIDIKCLEILRQNKNNEKSFLDQEALNIVCKDDIFYLPWKWNLLWLYSLLGREAYLKEYRVEYDALFEEALEDIKIIHYASDRKAIDYPDAFLADYFWKYVDELNIRTEMLHKKEERRIRKLKRYSIEYPLPKYKIAVGSRIIIYGAGEVGTAFKEQIDLEKSFTLVAWIDKRYEHYRRLGLKVEGIEKINTYQFDYLLIAIKNPRVVSKIVRELVVLGIEELKIIGFGL